MKESLWNTIACCVGTDGMSPVIRVVRCLSVVFTIVWAFQNFLNVCLFFKFGVGRDFIWTPLVDSNP